MFNSVPWQASPTSYSIPSLNGYRQQLPQISRLHWLARDLRETPTQFSYKLPALNPPRTQCLKSQRHEVMGSG